MSDLYKNIKAEMLLDSKELLERQKESHKRMSEFLKQMNDNKNVRRKNKKDEIFKKKIKRTVWTKVDKKGDKQIIAKFVNSEDK